MGFTKDAVVLDIGTSKISVFVGFLNEFDIFNIKSCYHKEYAGFLNGEWLEIEKLNQVVSDAITTALKVAKVRKPKKIYVGVPSEFSTVKVKEENINFDVYKTITADDVNNLFENGNTFKNNEKFVTINSSPIYYKLEDNNRIMDPVGRNSSRLSGVLSYILCEKSFIKLFENIARSIGIKQVEFINQNLATVLGMFECDQRDRYVVMLDVGYLTSSVVVARGDGLLHMASFALGGAHITADISQYLNISYSKALEISSKLDLNLMPKETDVITVPFNGDEYDVPIADINALVYDRLDVIGEYVKKAIQKCEFDFPSYLPVYLTGGGISYMRGAKTYISSLINRPIEIASPNVPIYNGAEYSTLVGLLYVASKNERKSKNKNMLNVFKKLLTR